MFQNLKDKMFGVVAGVTALMLPGMASAEPASGADALFGAVDVSGLAGNVQTILIAFIGIAILFLAYRLIKRSIARG